MRALHYQLCAVVDLSFLKVKKNSVVDSISMFPALQYTGQDDLYPGEGGTLEISGWGCVAGILEHLTYTRASSAEFCYPILEETPQIPPYPRVAVSLV